MGPVFLIVLDVDVEDKIAILYPELYKELQKGLVFIVEFLWRSYCVFKLQSHSFKINVHFKIGLWYAIDHLSLLQSLYRSGGGGGGG